MTDINVLLPKIGTRVYIVVPDKFVVVPAVVIEKVTRETPNGTSTSYLLNFGEQGRERVPSDQVANSIVVATRQDAYDILCNSAKERANIAIQAAATKGNQRFGPEPEPESKPGLVLAPDVNMEVVPCLENKIKDMEITPDTVPV